MSFLCEGMSEEGVMSWRKVVLRWKQYPPQPLTIPFYFVLNPCEVVSTISRYDGLQFGPRGKATTFTEDMLAESRAEGFNEVVRGRIFAGNYFLLKKHYSEIYM